MKKNYIAPAVEVYDMKSDVMQMALSGNFTGTGADVRSIKSDFVFEDEDEDDYKW